MQSSQSPNISYQFIKCCWLCLLSLLVCCATISHAEEKFLASEQAFAFQARSISNHHAELTWQIADHYYLYRHQFKLAQGTHPLHFNLPAATAKHDAYFGDTQVYFHSLTVPVEVKPNQSYVVTFQGCAEQGLCYPIQQKRFATDAEGLVIRQDSTFPAVKKSALFAQAASTAPATVELPASTAAQATAPEPDPRFKSAAATPAYSAGLIAQDQAWSSRLQQQSLLWSSLVFLGLGCLLAFSPCSLPMLPILSSLLLRKQAGVKAGLISCSFVLSMAMVYALLGVLAASAGTNFQRWLQQPVVLICFSLVFVVFALNLFGWFELKLPQQWLNKLDQLQAKQKGGTLAGAAVMGILSALLVGPCMTAPLAGILLYITQSENRIAGALLLFALGIGMGIPLIILSIIGQKALPKPGAWMNNVRYCFAFVMLGLSLYFIRPLLSAQLFQLGLLAIAIGLALYLIRLLSISKAWGRYVAVFSLLGVIAFSVWQVQHYWHMRPAAGQTSGQWQVVHNKTEFDTALQQARAQQRSVIVDLYADWCIACQPIETTIWRNAKVQSALADSVRIKLDLSQYEQSQQAILNGWQMLGPPTVLFIQPNGQEFRGLRLTGEFSLNDLLQRLDQR